MKNIVFTKFFGGLTNNSFILQDETKQNIEFSKEKNIEIIPIIEKNPSKKIISFLNNLNIKYFICLENNNFMNLENMEVLFKNDFKNNNAEIEIKKIIDYFKINIDDCMFVGVDNWDISLLKLFKNSYAMEDSAEEVKNKSNFYTSCVDQNGLGRAIIDFMFRNKLDK